MKSEKKFEAQMNISLNDYKKTCKTMFPMYLKRTLIIIGLFSLFALIGYFSEDNINSSFIEMLGGVLIIFVAAYLIVLLINKIMYKIKYNRIKKNYKITFYDDHLKIDDDVFGYKSIDNYYENNELIYFFVEKNILVLFDKKIENEDFIEYIRMKIVNKKEYIDVYIRFKKIIIMVYILSILSILSIIMINIIPKIIATLSLPKVLLNSFPDLTFTFFGVFDYSVGGSYLIIDYYEYSFILIVFPLLLFILAKKLKRSGIKCRIYIVCAVITAIIITIFSLGYSKYKTRINYDSFKNHQDIAGINIPKNGMYFKALGNDDSELSVAYFKDENDIEQIENEIQNNSNWLKIESIDEALYEYLNSNGTSKDIYYLLYNVDENNYNVIPTTRNHTIYSMSYNPHNKILKIEMYKE